MEQNAIGKYRWTICALVFFATTINYLDRQVLSLLAPELSAKFGWTNTDYANITAVFQFVYAISMLFAGRIIDRLGTKMGFTWAIICVCGWRLRTPRISWSKCPSPTVPRRSRQAMPFPSAGPPRIAGRSIPSEAIQPCSARSFPSAA